MLTVCQYLMHYSEIALAHIQIAMALQLLGIAEHFPQFALQHIPICKQEVDEFCLVDLGDQS